MRIKTLQLKKTAFAVLIGLLLSVAGVTKAFAQTFTVGNLNYSVNDDGVSVTVTGHVDGQNATGELVIPESVEYEGNAYSVTIIDVYAFRYCSNLTGELIIPNSVIEIRMGAFSYCSGFSSLTIGTGVTLIGSNDYGYLYQHTNPFGYCSGITTIYYNAINCNLTPVGDNWNNAGSPFANCQSLTYLYVGENVQYLPYYAFKNCSALTTLYFNATNCISGGAEWISNCTSLENLFIADNVQAIPSHLVEGCSSLTGNLSIPNTVTSIGDYAFNGCSNLTGNLSIPNTVTSIGDYAFSGCSNLTGNLVIPNSVNRIGYYVFNGCSNLTGDLVIPNSVTTISDCAFANCTGFSSLTIGTGLRQWDNLNGLYYVNSPFYNCTGITTINYNATYYDGMLCVNSDEGDCYNMQSIFSTCTSLTTINIGENVQSIPTAAFKHTNVNTVNFNATNCNSMGGYYCTEQYVFEACEQLTTINIGENVQTIPSNAFRNCTNLSGALFIPESVTSIGNSAFRGCVGLTGSMNLPNPITSIGESAFEGCTGLSGTLSLPNSLTSIGGSAFYGCSGLIGELTIPESVTSIGGCAFWGTGFTTLNFNAVNCGSLSWGGDYNGTWDYYSCLIGIENLATLNIGENVQSIPYCAFKGVSGLVGNLTIPESVTSIGGCAFLGTGFTTLNFNAVNCGSLRWSGYYNGTWDYYSCLIGIENLVTLNIGENVQSIPEYAFKGYSGLVGELTIPGSVTSIGLRAFDNCSGFTSLTIDMGVENIGVEAFKGCSGFTGALTMPESIVTIGGGSFEGCSGMSGTLTIKPNVTFVGARAFAYTGIETVIFNAINCEDNGAYYNTSNYDAYGSTFEGCESLTTLVVVEGVKRIPIGVFYECSSLTGELLLPESLIEIGDEAFYGCSGFTGSLIIPDAVTYIGGYAFGDCTGFDGILKVGESVSYMGGSAFNGAMFNTLYYNAINCGMYYYSWNGGYESSFSGCNNLTQLVLGESVQSISGNAFRGLSGLTGTLTLPNSLKSIGDQAFYDCYGLEGIEMGNGVETIGTEAFRNCGGLRGELTLPETLQSVGNYAFASCDELTTINYNAINCTAMGNAQSPVFYDCASMAHINIGENVESIPNYAFKRCSTVTDMTVAATVPPTVGSSTFGTLQRSIPVTVQCEATAAYQAAQYWNEFTNYNEGFNYVLEVTCDPERGTVVVNKMADCDDPTARVTAYPEIGYAFLGWSENGMLVSEANPYTFTMESSRELQAEFIPGVSYSVTVSVVPAAAGTVTGQGNYNDGSAVTLTATTNPGYAFVNWTENGSVVSTDEEYTFTIHANRNLVANFTPYAYHWDVNIHQYPGNMTAIGVIQIDGVEQTTPTLEIGAFCNDECRGRQLLTYYPQVDRYMVFLMLYGEDGDEMSFKLYDHILEQELTLSCTSLVTFAANTALGNPVNPYVFNFINSQQTPLAEGWTWYSTYIEQEDIEGLQMMTEALNESGVMIKSQTGFIANSGGQWMGNLDEITNESMYMVNTTAATLLDMVGNSAIASQHPITMNPGWNWIGYPMATANSVSVALSDIEAQPNDVLKSQESFATYYEGMGWFGSLNTITPGMGLMYDSKNDAPVTFTYTEGRSGELKRNMTAESNHWVPDMHKYTNNMNVMAVVELDDVELRDSGYELAVFAGNECRGSVRLVYVEPIDRYVAFLTIAGREATDLQFVLFDADENREYGNAKESLVFESDAVVGNTKSMMTVHFASCEQENDWSKIAVYPNPADGGEHFSIVLPAASDQKVRVEIINELGAVVSVAQSSSLPMEMKAPATPGLYTLKIVAEGNAVCFRKLVVK